MPLARLSSDSNRSPMMPMIAISTPSSTIRPIGASGMAMRARNGVGGGGPDDAGDRAFDRLLRADARRQRPRPIVRPP